MSCTRLWGCEAVRLWGKLVQQFVSCSCHGELNRSTFLQLYYTEPLMASQVYTWWVTSYALCCYSTFVIIISKITCTPAVSIYAINGVICTLGRRTWQVYNCQQEHMMTSSLIIFFFQLQWAWYKCYVYVDVLVYTVKPSTTTRPYLVVCADLSDSDGFTVLSQLGHTSAVACWTGYRMSVHQWNDKLMPKWMQASPIHMSNLYMPNCSGNWSGSCFHKAQIL